MNRQLEEVIKVYSLEGSKALIAKLANLSKPTLVSLVSDLLTMYMNDANSSTLREFVTVSVAGYKHKEEKIGYNGFRHSTYGRAIMCEAKPVNVRSSGERKLNGGANFTDFTWKRLKKYLKDRANIVVSGFVDGKLVYVFEFSVACKKFINRIKEKLGKHLPHGDIKNRYVRSLNFTFSDYKDCDSFRVIFVARPDELKRFERHMTKSLFKFLMGVSNGNRE